MADIKERNSPDLGTWATFQPGWWVLHLISIIVVGYLGYYILAGIM
ncbi:hypothetical protein [Desulfofalx alkaliphila]|nr:hypothetical protein [Desulfofalx alkaliphila]